MPDQKWFFREGIYYWVALVGMSPCLLLGFWKWSFWVVGPLFGLFLYFAYRKYDADVRSGREFERLQEMFDHSPPGASRTNLLKSIDTVREYGEKLENDTEE